MSEQADRETRQSAANVTGKLTLDDFAYDLPPELIAAEPSAERCSSRLLVLERKSGKIEHRTFVDLPEYLQEGDVLVLNDTRVIPARILASRQSGGQMELLLLKHEPARPGVWQAMANPLRRLKTGDSLFVKTADGEEFSLAVLGFVESADAQRRVLIDFGGQAEIHSLLAKIGQAPLPPYIVKKREGNSSALAAPKERQKLADMERYQTVYARTAGAVAAPTAGLHFTEALLEKIASRGVNICYVTLHVGAGTFKPINSSLEEHSIEKEDFVISAETARIVNKCRKQGGRIFAVGTTSCRCLETAGAGGTLRAEAGAESSLYIRPGFEFKMVDSLITNFHLSKSSLLVLVSAFAGHEQIMAAYREAVASRYRFYSYGDSMLIL